jgi:hypothetical protein
VAELDHILCMCPPGAVAAAEALTRIGLIEGSPNAHPGQGTACRRFFFENAYLELAWVSDAQEAQRESVRRTRLWERWAGREAGACPFGVALRASAGQVQEPCPFPAWTYRPAYFPAGAAVELAQDTPIEEPEYLYLAFQRGRARAGAEPTAHELPIRRLTGLTLGLPYSATRSGAARRLEELAVLSFVSSEDYVVLLRFDDEAQGGAADLRPAVPLVLRW